MNKIRQHIVPLSSFILQLSLPQMRCRLNIEDFPFRYKKRLNAMAARLSASPEIYPNNGLNI